MNRPSEDLGHRAGLDHLPRIHHNDPITYLSHHSKVMRDEEYGHAVSSPKIREQLEDLCLNRHVERRRRLIAIRSLGSHDKAIAIITR